MAITIASNLTLDQTAYDLATHYALRPELYFDPFATVRPERQAMPGTAVIMHLTSDIAAATTALDESTDITPATMSDSQVTITLVEHGNAIKTTMWVRATSYVVPFSPIVANLIGFNAGSSLDLIARNTFQAGDNVRYTTGGSTTPGGRTAITPGDVLEGANVMRAVADLRGANVRAYGGQMTAYAGMMHPDVSYDFRQSTGGANWRDPHTYASPEGIWNGELGMFESVRWIEASRAPVFADAGSSTTLTDVYATLVWGQEAFAKAYAYTEGLGALPQVVPGPVTDTLRRFVPLGWYWLGGYAVFRQAALRRIESSSSIGTNA